VAYSIDKGENANIFTTTTALLCAESELIMQLKMYSIRDSKSEIFNRPFFKNTEGEALRDFETGVKDPSTMLHNHPEDFDLFYLGVYDDNTGKMESLPTPKHVIKAVNCLKVEQRREVVTQLKPKKSRKK